MRGQSTNIGQRDGQTLAHDILGQSPLGQATLRAEILRAEAYNLGMFQGSDSYAMVDGVDQRPRLREARQARAARDAGRLDAVDARYANRNPEASELVADYRRQGNLNGLADRLRQGAAQRSGNPARRVAAPGT